MSLLDAFERLEKVFDHETKTTRIALITVRDLVVEHYQRVNQRQDIQAEAIREIRADVEEIREHLEMPGRPPRDGL